MDEEREEGQENSGGLRQIGKGQKAKIRKSLRERFVETFIAEDITKDDIREYILKDVIVPAIQDAIMDGINGALGMMFGISISRAARSSKSSSSSGTKINYSGRFTSENSRKESRVVRKERGGELETQMFDNQKDAIDAVQEMEEGLKRYGRVSRADYYDCFGKDTEFTDNNIGWTDLSKVRIQRVPKAFVNEDTGRKVDGWAVIMPREESLD